MSSIQANALNLPLPDESVDTICTSPPYFALRSYRDGGEYFQSQLGSESTPTEFLDALIAATAEMVRVLKPTGSIFVNLGDKYAGGQPHHGWQKHWNRNWSEDPGAFHDKKDQESRRTAPANYGRIPTKSLMGLPWRYANRVVDDLSLILREEIIWQKPNGLPESVRDRCRRSHEQVFHFTRQGEYYSAVDEIREVQTSTAKSIGTPQNTTRRVGLLDATRASVSFQNDQPNPLGKLPGSVWTIPSEPLRVPDHLGVEHFAAFPQELPRRIILGWSPKDVCTGCGAGKRPVVDREFVKQLDDNPARHQRNDARRSTAPREDGLAAWGFNLATITGYECDCDGTAPTTPGIVIDPFGGTGTTAMVARALGRTGLSFDLSHDYCRLAQWRIYESGDWAKLFGQKVKREMTNQGTLPL